VDGRLRWRLQGGSAASPLRYEPAKPRASFGITTFGCELGFQVLLELHQILRQRHAIGLELVQLLADQLVKLMQVLRLVLHPRQKQAQLGFLVFECHLFPPSAPDLPGTVDGEAAGLSARSI
jgi:hypothetical protein